MSLPAVKLDDKYELETGRVYLTGSQAFVRLLLAQRRLDLKHGLNTAGFVTGYRGSPMTAIDEQLWRAGEQLEKHHVKFWPAINEDLGATALWGSQQVGFFDDAKYDGVFSMWYGKGPGLDRSLDVIRQGNWHGATQHGGTLVLAGDDPAMTSTINAYHSELLFEDLLMPVLYPADIQEVFDLGLMGIAMSRFSGSWIGFKCLPETIETAASIEGDPERLQIVTPDFDFPADGVNARLNDMWYLQETRIRNFRLPAALAFARANKLNRVSHSSPKARFGIVAMGKQWRDTLQALADLGIDQKTAADIGITVLKISMPYPADIQLYREFARGLDEVLVIEDKREQLENGLRNACYALPEAERPRIVGRQDENGQTLVSCVGDLTPDQISLVIAARISVFHNNEAFRNRLAFLTGQTESNKSLATIQLKRLPYFCPGCPHNISTRVPDGSIGFGGVGCHFMANWMDREVYGYTQMGGEGAQWIGQAPYVNRKHVFQQLGDGTYYHSGSLAIRAAVAAKINITYKILYNDAVAMTGGQPVDGPIDVPSIAHQVFNEGVNRIVVVSDEPEKYASYREMPKGTTIHHRDELISLQEELSEIKGVTILIYDQTCAAEKRRRRKRGKYPDPAKRVFINDRVCEGCGDCGVQSNCIAILPVDTEFGRKREIDQSACNKDFSCLKGFCPSFVTVLGGKPRKGTKIEHDAQTMPLIISPQLPRIPAGNTYGILLAGVGGTGVVTIGAILGMAGHLDQKGVSIVDQMGFAQKGGPVTTHIRLGNTPEEMNSARINAGSADLILGFDMLVAGEDKVLNTAAKDRTHAVINVHRRLTGDFTRNADLQFPGDALKQRLMQTIGKENTDLLNASRIATKLLGDSIASNLFMVGFAWQKGLVPLSLEALYRAIELNGVAVAWNQESFEWGRRAAANPELVENIAFGEKTAVAQSQLDTEQSIERYTDELTNYQSQAYAERYRVLVDRVCDAESAKAPGMKGLGNAVTKYAYKLMAYKDEYEVGRLYSDPEFKRKLHEQFEGNFKLEFNLAPPMLSRIDKKTGKPGKMQFGAWVMPVFGMLAKLKFLRGTPLDIFGYTAERREERELIEEYFSLMDEIIDSLNTENHALAVELASLPEKIRGYGHIKQAHLQAFRKQHEDLLKAFRSSQDLADAA
jgi:indolepyruvate ferredoxin oxidoreductase